MGLLGKVPRCNNVPFPAFGFITLRLTGKQPPPI
jgi:hypothetical protein